MKNTKADPSSEPGWLEMGIIDGRGAEPGLGHGMFVEPDSFDPLPF